MQGETPASIQAKTQAIADFSELGDFLNMPVHYYSSGMMVRLAFSIATAIEPEILIIDEVLAAGDMAFQAKARERMKALMSNARVVIVVSHDLKSLPLLCDKAIWLDHGQMQLIGPTEEVIAAYTQQVNGGASSAKRHDNCAYRGQVRICQQNSRGPTARGTLSNGSIERAVTLMRLLYFSPVHAGSYAQRPHFMVRAWLDWGIESVLWVNPVSVPAAAVARPAPQRWLPDEQGRRSTRAFDVLDVPALPIEPLPLGPWLNRRLLWRDAWRGSSNSPSADELCRHSCCRETPLIAMETNVGRHRLQCELIVGVGRPVRWRWRRSPAASGRQLLRCDGQFSRVSSRALPPLDAPL